MGGECVAGGIWPLWMNVGVSVIALVGGGKWVG